MKYLYAYRNIAIPSNIVTIIACYTAWQSESISELSLLFWMKLITSMFLVAYIHLFRQHLLYFFMNLGIGRLRFYSGILLIDLSIFVFMVLIITILK